MDSLEKLKEEVIEIEQLDLSKLGPDEIINLSTRLDEIIIQALNTLLDKTKNKDE